MGKIRSFRKKLQRFEWKIIRRLKVIQERITGLDFFENHSLKELGFTEQEANIYSATPERDLHSILKDMDIQTKDAIFDFGAGKGAAMTVFSKYPFNKIGGVELNEKIYKIAQKNFTKLRVPNVRIMHDNAMNIDQLDDYNFFYFFNPFPEVVLKKVLENIKSSVQKNPRIITIIYYLPAFRKVFDNDSFLHFVKQVEGRYYNMLIYSSAVPEKF